jgi:hypothetical protein
MTTRHRRILVAIAVLAAGCSKILHIEPGELDPGAGGDASTSPSSSPSSSSSSSQSSSSSSPSPSSSQSSSPSSSTSASTGSSAICAPDQCGGLCGLCAAGQGCAKNADCQSHVCEGGVCKASNCVDGVANGSETDVDCGGSCAGCAGGKACNKTGDCASPGQCVAHACCASEPKATVCAGKCGMALDNCGLPVNCGMMCGPLSMCVQGVCVCLPEMMVVTCLGKCGIVDNNCGQPIDCGACGGGTGGGDGGP